MTSRSRRAAVSASAMASTDAPAPPRPPTTATSGAGALPAPSARPAPPATLTFGQHRHVLGPEQDGVPPDLGVGLARADEDERGRRPRPLCQVRATTPPARAPLRRPRRGPTPCLPRDSSRAARRRRAATTADRSSTIAGVAPTTRTRLPPPPATHLTPSASTIRTDVRNHTRVRVHAGGASPGTAAVDDGTPARPVDDRRRRRAPVVRSSPGITQRHERRGTPDVRRPPLGGSGGRLPVRLGGEEPGPAARLSPARQVCTPQGQDATADRPTPSIFNHAPESRRDQKQRRRLHDGIRREVRGQATACERLRAAGRSRGHAVTILAM